MKKVNAEPIVRNTLIVLTLISLIIMFLNFTYAVYDNTNVEAINNLLVNHVNTWVMWIDNILLYIFAILADTYAARTPPTITPPTPAVSFAAINPTAAHAAASPTEPIIDYTKPSHILSKILASANLIIACNDGGNTPSIIALIEVSNVSITFFIFFLSLVPPALQLYTKS
jgi:hypothetical protein